MNRAAQTITGFLLILACAADVALMMTAKDLTASGQPQSLLTKPDWDIDGHPVRPASPSSQPLPWRMSNPPADVLPPPTSRSAEIAVAPTAAVARIKGRSRHPKIPSNTLDAIEVRLLPPLVHRSQAASYVVAPAPHEQLASAVTVKPDTSQGRDVAAPAHIEAVSHGEEALTADAGPGNVETSPVSASSGAQAKEEHLAMDAPATPAGDPAKAPDGTRAVRAPASEETMQGEVDALLASVPASLGDYLTRGSLLLRRGRSKEAVADFERASLMDPASSAARAGLAVAEALSGDEAAAAADLDKAIALNPKEPLAFDARAVIAQKQGKAAEAVDAYGQALELNGGDEFARKQRSVLEVALGRTDAALADTAELLRTGASPLAARFLRVEIFAGHDQLDDALKEADAAVGESPDVAEAYVLRGVVLAKQGKIEEAQALFTRSLTLRPTTEDFAWVRAQPRPGSAPATGLCWAEAPTNISLDLALKDCVSGSTKSSPSTVSDRGEGPSLAPAAQAGPAPAREGGSMP